MDTQSLETFGMRLARVRKARGVTQGELSRATGIQVQHISRWETDERSRLRSDVLIRLCLALSISADFLLGLQLPPPRAPRST